MPERPRSLQLFADRRRLASVLALFVTVLVAGVALAAWQVAAEGRFPSSAVVALIVVLQIVQLVREWVSNAPVITVGDAGLGGTALPGEIPWSNIRDIRRGRGLEGPLWIELLSADAALDGARGVWRDPRTRWWLRRNHGIAVGLFSLTKDQAADLIRFTDHWRRIPRER